MKSAIYKLALGLLLSGVCSPFLIAQHAMHDMGGAETMGLQSMPADDAVLATAPDHLMLHFASEVRLVKLALRNTENALIDIGFRYDPEPGIEFMKMLPPLPADDYYRVEWAVLDENDTLVRGSFHFAFGRDARPPSYWLEQQDQMQHIMSPDYRLLQPPVQ